MSEPKNGADIVVRVENPAGSGTFVMIGAQRDATITKEVAEVDFSSKDSHHEKVGYGRHSSTVTMEALYLYPYDLAWQRLQQARDDRELVLLQKYDKVTTDIYEQAEAVITNLDENLPDQAEGTISATFRVSEGWQQPS